MWYVSLSIALTQIFFRDLEEKKMFRIKSNKLPEKKKKSKRMLYAERQNVQFNNFTRKRKATPSVHTMTYEVKQEAR